MRIQELRTGAKILFRDEPWEVVHSDFMKKAQRRPVMRTRIRNLKTGQVIEQSFKQGDNVKNIDLTTTQVQYLYSDNDGHHFMRQDTYEQIDVAASILENKVKYLKEGQDVTVQFYKDEAIGVDLPTKVELLVKEAPPGIRGDTATSANKDIILENGLKVKAPLFINEGDTIRVDTRTGNYAERV